MFEKRENQIKNIIHDFQASSELDKALVELFIEEFQKPGLIILPVGKTFEEGIYPSVNQYFRLESLEFRGENLQDQVFKDKQKLIHPSLFLSHLDELINSEKVSFSNRLRVSLSNVIDQAGERFLAIDINSYEDFDRFVKLQGGPRVIFMGLGEDDSTAHVAFIGEEFINTTTTVVTLSEKTSINSKCSTAVTIGTDIFKYPSIESLIVVAKGKSKAESLKAAFDGPDTGLGYLITYHSDKLKIFADREAMSLLLS